MSSELYAPVKHSTHVFLASMAFVGKSDVAPTFVLICRHPPLPGLSGRAFATLFWFNSSFGVVLLRVFELLVSGWRMTMSRKFSVVSLLSIPSELSSATSSLVFSLLTPPSFFLNYFIAFQVPTFVFSSFVFGLIFSFLLSTLKLRAPVSSYVQSPTEPRRSIPCLPQWLTVSCFLLFSHVVCFIH